MNSSAAEEKRIKAHNQSVGTMRTPAGGQGSEGHEQLPQKWLETTVEDKVRINFDVRHPTCSLAWSSREEPRSSST